MLKHNFPDEDRRQIDFERYHHPDPRVMKRMHVWSLMMRGMHLVDMVRYSKVSRSTIDRVRHIDVTQGLEGVRAFHEKGPTGALLAHRTGLETELREHPPKTVGEAAERIEKLTGIRRQETPVRQFLRNTLGLGWRKVSAIPVPPKKSVDEHAARQAAFLQTDWEPRLNEAREGQRSVLFRDASQRALGSFWGWVWCWVRLHVRAASVRQCYNLLGAFNPLTQELSRVCNCTYVNSSTVCELLQQIAAAGITTPLTIVLDNARYQRCKLVQDLAQQLHLELLFLPSYSLNLNLIERLWKFVKKAALNSRHNTNFPDFRAAIDDCLDHLADRHKEKVQSLITLSFQKFANVTLLPQSRRYALVLGTLRNLPAPNGTRYAKWS